MVSVSTRSAVRPSTPSQSERYWKKRNLVVTTGTGSGKTESFLLPILAKLAVEASEAPDFIPYPSGSSTRALSNECACQ